MVIRSSGTEKANTQKSINKVVAGVKQTKATAKNSNQIGESRTDAEYLFNASNRLKIN
jgi:hypothetical protein